MYVVCQVKLFLHFILLAPYLFNCLSASLLGYAQAPGVCLCVCLCAATAKVRRQTACCVKGCRGNVQTPSQRGIVCEIQMLEMARLFAYCYHCSLAKRRTVLGFDLTREKQNDKLSHQLSSNPPPPLHFPLSPPPHPAVDIMKRTTDYKVIHRQRHNEETR